VSQEKEKADSNMTTTNKNNSIRQILTVAIVSVVCLVASIAAADDVLSVTVRITDAAAIEREIGECDSGLQVLNEADSGSRLVSFRGGEATLTSRNSLVAPGFYCAGTPRPMPSTGYSIVIR